MNKKYLRNISFLLVLIVWYSCETPFVPDTIEADQQYVVEGFVEAGDNAMPTYVLLTRSLPFIGEVGPDKIMELQVHDAIVTVDDGDKTTTLPEICLDDLPSEVREQVAISLGLEPDSILINICAYVDLFGEITQEVGRSYDLRIEVEDNVITSTTTIPPPVPLYNLTWENPPGDPNDTMATLKVTIDDPATEKNFYRYFSSANGSPLVAPFASVVNDALFDGEEFEFPLNQAISRNEEFDVNTAGLWTRGDTIVLKWCTIDEAHFDFWETFDFNNNNNGPFSSYTRVASNVDGALGVWGGYAVNYYEEVVE